MFCQTLGRGRGRGRRLIFLHLYVQFSFFALLLTVLHDHILLLSLFSGAHVLVIFLWWTAHSCGKHDNIIVRFFNLLLTHDPHNIVIRVIVISGSSGRTASSGSCGRRRRASRDAYLGTRRTCNFIIYWIGWYRGGAAGLSRNRGLGYIACRRGNVAGRKNRRVTNFGRGDIACGKGRGRFGRLEISLGQCRYIVLWGV